MTRQTLVFLHLEWTAWFPLHANHTHTYTWTHTKWQQQNVQNWNNRTEIERKGCKSSKKKRKKKLQEKKKSWKHYNHRQQENFCSTLIQTRILMENNCGILKAFRLVCNNHFTWNLVLQPQCFLGQRINSEPTCFFLRIFFYYYYYFFNILRFFYLSVSWNK